MKAWLIAHAAQLVIGPAVGALTFALHEQLQRAVAWFDTQPAYIKRVATVILAAVLAPLGTMLGVSIPDACAASGDVVACLTSLADTTWLGAALGVVVAEGIHRISKKL